MATSLRKRLSDLNRKIRGRPPRLAPHAQALETFFSGRDVEVVFDVGANIGGFSAEMLGALAPKQIHSFEPVGQNYRQLVERFKSEHRVTPHKLAVGSEVGEVTLNLNAERKYNNSLLSADQRVGNWVDIAHEAQEKVRCETVDHFASAHGIDRIDILKVDAEGADLMVVQGASELLRRQAIGAVYVEVLFKPVFEGQGRLIDFLREFDRYGYQIVNLFDPRLTSQGQLNLANLLVVAPELVAPC